MKTSHRFLFQAFFWLVIWLTLWVIETEKTLGIAWENFVILGFQICLIGGIIYFAVPNLLFKKKTLFFWVLIVIAILLFSFIAAQLLSILGFQAPHPPPPKMGERPPPMGPSRFIVNFFTLSITALVSIIIETFLFAQKQERETILSKNEMLQTELKLLKFQINPHFLFNTLNNIYTLSVIDSNKTQQSIAYLSTMLRYVLYDCEEEFVQIHQEMAYIENYLALFCLKSTNSYSISFEKKIESQNTKIAPMLLIPFVENALKHSHIEKRGASFIKIQILEERGSILFEVENSKPRTEIQKDSVGGIGLENVKKRLAILYPEQHTLSIKENAETFKVTLIIDPHEST
jgi:two-component system, LytTR family, sensor kinase